MDVLSSLGFGLLIALAWFVAALLVHGAIFAAETVLKKTQNFLDNKEDF